MLLAEHLGEPVIEGRVRYHADEVTVRVPVGPAEHEVVRAAVVRARALAVASERPPVTEHEGRCIRCAAAPTCLPEETRLLLAATRPQRERPTPVRLFPPDLERRSLHVVTQGGKVGRAGEGFRLSERDGSASREVVGARETSDIVLHGFAQITTQALRLAADQGIPVHVVTTTGALIGSFWAQDGNAERRLRQYRALSDEAVALALARRLAGAKIELQLRHLLRATRGSAQARSEVTAAIEQMRGALRRAHHAETRAEIMGHEGSAALAWFGALPGLVAAEAGAELRPDGRSRRPPRDRFNALLSFAYGLLYRDVVSAIVRVGLDPSLGFLHQPQAGAFPLALDLMELFRVPIVDLAVLAAVNRRTFDPTADFEVRGAQVWLSESGRRALIEVYERRKAETCRHPVLDYSLSSARMMELEARLLEKEWSAEGGLFARFRIR
jgi:CRISPR-associated protein Cas1